MNNEHAPKNRRIHRIPALDKAAAVLAALAEGSGPRSSAGLSRKLAISQSTCYRILQTLQGMEWIQPDGEGGYELGAGLLRIVRPLLGTERLVEAALPHLRDLARITDLTAKLSVRRGSDQVTVARVESPRPLAVTGRVGSRYPVVLGASGAALLSLLAGDDVEQILAHTPVDAWGNETAALLRQHIAACRRDRVCANIGHHPQGIDTLSASVRTAAGPAAVTLVGLRGDLASKRLPGLREALKQAAAAIETAALAAAGPETD